MNAKVSKQIYRFSKIFTAHQAFVVIVCVLAVLLLVLMRINTLSNLPINQAYLNTETESIKTVRFNQEAIEKIKTLNESNVEDPGTQLPGNRENPFSE